MITFFYACIHSAAATRLYFFFSLSSFFSKLFLNSLHFQVFWVSLGNPTYKFCVFREAVRGLTGPKLARMLDDIMTSLYQAHSDKNFDVIGTVCDGAAEQ